MDSRQYQHRPRTTRQLRNRLMNAVEEATGQEPDHFHDALRIAVGYLELGLDELPDCPYCGKELSRVDDTRYSCHDPDCTRTENRYVPWYHAVGLPERPETLSNPSDSSDGTHVTTRGSDHFTDW